MFNVNIQGQVEKEAKVSFSLRTQVSVILKNNYLLFIMIATMPLYVRYCDRPDIFSASLESRRVATHHHWDKYSSRSATSSFWLESQLRKSHGNHREPKTCSRCKQLAADRFSYGGRFAFVHLKGKVRRPI